MRIQALVSLAIATALLSACASVHGRVSVESEVLLGPGGRAEGRVTIPAGAAAKIELSNEGPGRADYVIRTADGQQLASGALHEASAGLTAGKPTVVVIVLETYSDAGTRVEYELKGSGALALEWDLSRAFPKAQAR